MTLEEKYNVFQRDLNEEVDFDVFKDYLRFSTERILNHRYPFGTTLVEVEPKYENQQIELAIVLYNQRGAEGEKVHNENGINRSYRTIDEILKSIPRVAGIPQ